MVANIRVIQEREDRENPVLARQRMKIEALRKGILKRTMTSSFVIV